jgi:1-acyl-sn-glycerol-3-phosphate acyltransferase
MKQQVNYIWRIFATGLSFSVFGLGGVVIGGVVFPSLLLITRDAQQRQIKAQRLIQYGFSGFVQMMRALGIMTYEINGLEKLQDCQGEIIVANHPTLIDVVVLISLLPRADCIVKKSLWHNPFTRGPVQAAGYILNDESSALIEQCVAQLEKQQAPLVIFPEGTRTVKGQRLNTFQRGAANIAVRAKANFRPVVIRCVPSTLTKNEKWYQVPKRPFHVTIDVKDTLSIAHIIHEASSPSAAARRVSDQLYQFFDQELQQYER